ncbi:MAG: cation diffusion facilitator family transporter [Bryobacteraceae bacterium]|nr:cation diffusion facilitator family transporter [Bryobacteraceae bacterium]
MSAQTAAYTEKNKAAANSVLAAIGLTSLKVVVGLLTGSLGILAEAAHSALDLVAAMMTWFAVRISGKPPDRDHLYGHGKVENLSALMETLLLLVTCVWVVYKAAARLTQGRTDIEVTVWSFAVMGISMAVDFSRSRMLSKAAKKHNSQALEADALHFSTDIWSSAVVIVGLAGVKLSEMHPALALLKNSDALSAICVAGIVFFICGRLGMRTVQALLDAVPKGLNDQIKQTAEQVPGILNCHKVRARYSGAQLFVDAHVLVDGTQSLNQAHLLTDEVEEAIQLIAPGADVTVHAEPATAETAQQQPR